jgi:uncharacterized membrane protein
MLRNTQETQETEADGVTISRNLFGFLILGIVLVFTGVLVLIVASFVFGNSGSVGGVILIGPIPIVLGAGQDAGWLILIGVVLTILSVVCFLVINRRMRKPQFF